MSCCCRATGQYGGRQAKAAGSWRGGGRTEKNLQRQSEARGEYSRSRLTSHQEGLFQAEVEKWIESGWLVQNNPEVHGQPALVLPLIAQVQAHEATQPVCPVLDYRLLNKHLISTRVKMRWYAKRPLGSGQRTAICRSLP